MDPDEDYFGKVEAYFVERRGSPLFITPSEWFLVAKWAERGIPLHVVEEGIDRVFERPRAPTAKPPKLGYCRQAVESAFRRFREVSLGGGEGGSGTSVEDRFDSAAHLAELAETLHDSAPAIADRIRALAERSSDLAAIEDVLTAMDEELLEEAERELDQAERDALLGAASDSLASYRDRMPDKVYESALKSAYRRRLRDHAKLPRLSLYDR